jgi:predicted RNA polymerase sigma factor
MILRAQVPRLLGIWTGNIPALLNSRSFEIQPLPALALVDGLDLDSYYLFDAIRGDLLRCLGCNAEAALAYQAAIARSENAVERDFLERRRQALSRD